MLKVPKINWIPFDKNNPPFETCPNEKYFILIREDDYDDGATWHYSVDVEVVAYAEFPYYLKECTLMEVE